MRRNSFGKQCRLIALMLTLSLSAAANPGAEQWRQYDIRVDGMTCPFCVATSQRALEKIAGVQAVASNLERGVISVCVDDRVVFTDHQLKELFLSKGFTFRSFTTAQSCSIGDRSVTTQTEELGRYDDHHDHHHTAPHGPRASQEYP